MLIKLDGLLKIVTIISLCWSRIVIFGFSNAGTNLILAVGVFYLGLALGLVWGLAYVFYLVCRNRERPKALFSLRPKYWFIPPVLMMVSFVLVVANVPQKIRFYSSLPSLNTYVKEVSVRGMESMERKTVGLYMISETESHGDGTIRLITSSDGFDDAGYVYCPIGNPKIIGEDSYRHLTGNWWHWRRSW